MREIEVDGEIALRWPSMADAEELFALVDPQRAYLGRWLPWVEGCTLQAEWEWIEGYQAMEAKGQGSPPLIIYRGALVGSCSVERIVAFYQACEIGYLLNQRVQGLGIVTRACRALLDYAFDSLGMHRVEIRVAPENTRSLAIPKRLGFVFEGILREAALVNREYLDQALYSMLAPDWTKQKASAP